MSPECRASISSLSIPHLLNIFGLRPSHKMSRLTADGPVTGVQDKRFLVGDGIVGVIDNVRSPVRQHMSISAVIVNVGESPVALTLRAHSPVPAAVFGRSTRHVLREKFCNSSARTHDRKRVAAPAPLLVVAMAPSLGPQGFSTLSYRTNFPRRAKKLVVVRASTLRPDSVGAAFGGARHPSTITEKRP